MAFLSMALVVGAVAGAFVAGGALDRGFPVEVAMVRGAVAFMGVALAGYLGELVVVTAPRRARPAAQKPAPVASAEEHQEAPPRPAAPRLITAGRPVETESNQDDADVDVRPAA